MKKSKLINFVIFIATLLPATYISLPFINASGCNYNIQIESATLFTRGLCNSGKIKTITNVKNSDIVVSQEFISAYRSPYLITILTDTDIIHHKNDSSEHRIQKSRFNPCTMSKINVYYVGSNKNDTFLIRKPLWGECKTQGATIYKTPIEGRFSHWE